MNSLRLLAPLAVLAFALPVRADVKLPAIFSEHMVLQRAVDAPVWGWADPGEEVTVEVITASAPAGETRSTKAGADGKWMVKLDALKAGDTVTLNVRGRNTLTIRDVLAGEVWLCSGQSNMTMPVQWLGNFEQEKAAADFPQLRMFIESSAPAAAPQPDGKGTWRICSPASVGGFSAVAYFFGRDVHPQNKQDVGKRLALWALAKVYDQKVASYSGPLASGHQIEGSKVVISFAHADGGLVAKDGELKGFAIAGADQKWVKANAKIEGAKVIVSSPEVRESAAVRYAWAMNPDCNLYNGAGLPASPFRTDEWR